ncbi:MAG: undecaprenyl-diphosphatase UppP [Candidatus Pacebacteria bacterium]|jgi:undecaprenyl-diphosphatase|nr:undecaprenyl-diphosphatase UppP [bacterium]MDP6527447.1 undecaprenyl-diphosphatase UppP [Candidatus Paceibacterota bacterium]MDP6659647.1 undecaprenyl-diphosphatase UppP [Candidatus Paceibacterota bacterium]|tara:strand:- start:3136 stop:3930 length:795 start_codon:yes stop_codon:yes gene_type:complete
MDLIFAIFLGVVQGLTEFLPISSSGHLILAREFFGVTGSYDLAVDALLHFATASAILVYFRKDFLRILRSLSNWLSRRPMESENKTLFFALVFGTLPAVVLGILLEGLMETTFRDASLVAWALILGSLLMLLGERLGRQADKITVRKGLIIGFFQSLALIPGMSRSGMAISGGLLLGLNREEATKFAFMLGFPILIGAGLAKAAELYSTGVLISDAFSLTLSIIAAFTTGLFAIHYLLKFLKNHSLNVFIIYRLALAALVLILL